MQAFHNCTSNTVMIGTNISASIRTMHAVRDAGAAPADLAQQLVDATQASAYFKTCTIALSLVLTFILLVIIVAGARRVFLAKKRRSLSSAVDLQQFKPSGDGETTAPAPAYFSSRRDEHGPEMV
jgi:hypothetical protein